MSGYAPGEQPRGGKFIKLNTNENPYPPSAAVMRAIAATAPQSLMRYPDPMATAFRLRAGEIHGAPPDWILCGNGSDDILTIVTRALVGSGELLRLPYPSYILYKTLAQIQGARFEEIRFESDWSLSESFAKPAPGLKLAFLPNPNSPTGTFIPRERILELADRLPCPLLVDEAYADFAGENCLDLVAKNEKIMVSRTLSKSHSLAGLRFGYLIAQPQMIAQFVKVKDSYNCDAISIAAAAAAIDDQAWLAETTGKIVATRARLAKGLSELGLNVIPSRANFVWCRPPKASSATIYEGLKSQGVLVRHMNYADWQDGMRISVGTDEQIDVCLSLLRELL
jgi:histidinol-phosphate aminotransferase